eukprot:gene9006-9179_t
MKACNDQQMRLACTSGELDATSDARKKLCRPKLKTLWALAITACVVYSLAQCGRSPGFFVSSRPRDGHQQESAAVLDTLAAEKAAFLQQHAAVYGYSGWIDRHWKTEVGDKLGVKLQYYLDYTAAALFTKSHLAAVTQMLSSTTLSNPHSRNPSSARSAQELLDAEQLVLEFFRADPNEYMVVWTRGATDALKMVGEWFPWTARLGWQPPRGPRVGLASSTEGRLYPMTWIDKIHAKSTAGHRWFVVLDAAAFVATHPLDLSIVHPDFVDVSFYKLFGFPTGLGCLIARKEVVALLHKAYFGGGTVEDATAENLWKVFLQGPDAYQDGTKNFLGIPMLQFGFKQLHELGGIKAVEAHTSSLQAWTYAALLRLKHSNGQPMVRLFGRHDDPKHQSAIFQMLVLSPEGAIWSPVHVEKAAAVAGLAIRTGCMCNPGQCYHDVDNRPEERRAAVLSKVDMSSGFFLANRTVAAAAGQGAPGPADHNMTVVVKLPTGSIRVSLGYLSTFEDCYAAARFILDEYRDVPATPEFTNIDHMDPAISFPATNSIALQERERFVRAGATDGYQHSQAQQQGRRQSRLQLSFSQNPIQAVRFGRLGWHQH